MRKIIAIVLAVVMIAAMSIPAFAAKDPTNLNEKEGSGAGTTTVTYGVSETFEVVIPADFQLDVNETTGVGTAFNKEVQVTKLQIFEGKKLTVSVTSEGEKNVGNEDYGWALYDSTNKGTVYYNIFQSDAVGSDANGDGTKIAHEADLFVLASVKQFSTKTTYLDFVTEATIQAGTFTDTLTFTAVVA